MKEQDELPKLQYYFDLLTRMIANLGNVSIFDSLPEAARIERTLRSLTDIVSSEYAFIGYLDQEKQSIVVESSFPAEKLPKDGFACSSQSTWKEVVDKHEFFAIDSGDMDQAAREIGIDTAIAAPFLLKGGIERIIACCNKQGRGPYPYQVYGSDEGKILEGIANVLAWQIDRDRVVRAELEQAAKVQRRLLPKEAPVVEGIDLAHRSIPAEMVGGDYYDFIPMTGSKTGIVIGDVSGHGLYAALVMVMVRSFIHFVTKERSREYPIEEILFQLNNVIYESVDRGMFVTLLYTVVDVQKQSITYGCAGHLPPLIYRPCRGSFDSWSPESSGLAVGTRENSMYRTHEVQLGQGDIIVLCTDGVHETEGQVEGAATGQFGIKRVETAVADVARKTAEGILTEVLKRVHEFGDAPQQKDDTSIIVMKVG